MPAISTIGVKVSYAIEENAGTRPTSGYKVFPMFKSSPDFNVAPSSADMTSFDNKEYTTKVSLLKDLPDVLTFTANYTPELIKFYNDPTNGMMHLYDEAKKEGKAMYICVDVPEIPVSTYTEVQPIPLGMPAMEANSGAEIDVYFAPIGEPHDYEDPTEYYSTTYQEWEQKING